MTKKERAWLLPALMIGGAALGLVVGALAGKRWADPAYEPLVLTVRAMGVMFISLLKALAIPLVATSVTLGVAQMGNARRVGRMLGITGLYFLATTLIAVVTGIVLVDGIHPGHAGGGPVGGFDAARLQRTPAKAIYDVIVSMFPPNVVGAFVDGNALGLICYGMLFGAVLGGLGERGRPLVAVIDAANETLMRFIRVVVWAAPVGIFGLVADRIGKAGGGAAVAGELTRLAWYGATVLIGLVIHGVITLPILLRVLARRSPAKFTAGMADSLLTAFGTASSAATMAVTMECLIDKNGVSREATDLVVPLGTTINMNGTALYEAVAVLFIAQSSGIELAGTQLVVVALTATLAAVGAAAVPEAGLVTMVLVLGAVGLPAEGVGILLSIDWILDRFRTVVNVWGDAVGAAYIDRELREATVSS